MTRHAKNYRGRGPLDPPSGSAYAAVHIQNVKRVSSIIKMEHVCELLYQVVKFPYV